MEEEVPAEARRALVRGLAWRFLVMFMAYAVIQNLESSEPGGHGLYVLMCIYFTYSLSNLFLASPIVTTLGPERAFGWASVAYSLFVTAHVIPAGHWLKLPATLSTAVVCGLGAAVLWTSQQSYIFGCAMGDTRNLGSYNQAFWSVFGWQQVFSNGAGTLLFLVALPHKAIYIIFALWSWVGTAYAFTLPRLPKKQVAQYGAVAGGAPAYDVGEGVDEPPPPAQDATLVEVSKIETASGNRVIRAMSIDGQEVTPNARRCSSLGIFDVAKLVYSSPQTILPLCAMYAFTGFSYSFAFALLPSLIPTSGLKTASMVLWGCSVVIGSRSGALSDLHGKKPLLAAVAVITATYCAALVLSQSIVADTESYRGRTLGGHWAPGEIGATLLLFFVAALSGFQYSTSMVLQNSVLTLHHATRINTAAACCNLFMNAMLCVSLLLLNYLSIAAMCGCLVATLGVVSIPAMLYLDKFVLKIDNV